MDNFKKQQLFDLSDIADDETEQSLYTSKISIPHYLPNSVCPNIQELYDDSKYVEMCNKIYESNLTEQEKSFLMLAASRHIVFNYAKIADFYAHQRKEMQEFMEDSALVIVDIEDAIANGYMRLSKNIERILRESGECSDEV